MKNFTKLLLILAIASTQDKAFASFAKNYANLEAARAAYKNAPSAATAKTIVDYYNQASPADKAKFNADLAARGGSVETYKARAGYTTAAIPAASAAAAAPSIAASAAGSKYAASATGTEVPTAPKKSVTFAPQNTTAPQLVQKTDTAIQHEKAYIGSAQLPVLADAKERREQELARQKRIEQLISDKRLKNRLDKIVSAKYALLKQLEAKAQNNEITDDERSTLEFLYEEIILDINQEKYNYLSNKENLSPDEEQEYIEIEKRLYPE